MKCFGFQLMIRCLSNEYRRYKVFELNTTYAIVVVKGRKPRVIHMAIKNECGGGGPGVPGARRRGEARDPEGRHHREARRTREDHLLPRLLGGRPGQGAGQPRLPRPVQLRHRPLQGRTEAPPLRQPVHPQGTASPPSPSEAAREDPTSTPRASPTTRSCASASPS